MAGMEYDGLWFTETKKGYYVYKGVFLHRYKWEHAFGKISEGLVLHHIDENKKNNDLNNFAIMTKSAHMSYHSANRSVETLNKLSKAKKGKQPWNKGKKLSDETKQKVSDSQKKRFKENPQLAKDISNRMKGKKHNL